MRGVEAWKTGCAFHLQSPRQSGQRCRRILSLGRVLQGLTGQLRDGLPDDAVVFSRRLQDLGLGYVCVSSGGIIPKIHVPVAPGYNAPFAARVRGETGLATQVVGMIIRPQQAEEIIASGQADMVCLATGLS